MGASADRDLLDGDVLVGRAAAGGVGLAAVQLAQRAGAEVIGTAGSPTKRAHLKSLGVRHAFDSRSLAFADDVATLTGGAGVDVILNSLADEFIPRSLSVLSEQGRFLEIGKRGVWQPAQVAQRVIARLDRAIFCGSEECPDQVGA